MLFFLFFFYMDLIESEIKISSSSMFIHDSDVTSVDGILVKDFVKYLGIYICESAQERMSLNFHPKFDSDKCIFTLWLQRDLTIYGRILLSKS